MGESDLRSRAVIQGKQVVHRLIGQGRATLMFKLRPEWKEKTEDASICEQVLLGKRNWNSKPFSQPWAWNPQQGKKIQSVCG